MQVPVKMKSAFALRITDWLKLAIILIVIYFTTNDPLVRFYELATSENPIRNRLVFIVVWGISLYVVITAAFLESILFRFAYASVVAISTFTSEVYKEVTNSALSYGDLYSLWIAREDYKSAISNYWQTSLIALGLSLLLWLIMVWPAHSFVGKSRIVKWGKYGFMVPFVLVALMVAKKGGGGSNRPP